jgi:hypothetical protein
MNERGPKIRVVCAASDPYFRDLFAICASSINIQKHPENLLAGVLSAFELAYSKLPFGS